MIRRVASVLLFIFGAWMLMGDLLMAFIDIEPGIADNAIMLGILAVIGTVPLLLGAWASPGRRWRELGLTLLMAVGVAVFCGVCMIAVFNDPGFKPFLPPDLKTDFNYTPALGFANLLLIGGLGWWLYRSKDGQQRAASEESVAKAAT